MFARLKSVYRVYLIVALALLIPAFGFLALWTSDLIKDEVARNRSVAINAAEDLMMLADARAHSDMNVLQVLARAPAVANLDLEAAQARMESVLDVIDGWKAVVLGNSDSGEILLSVSREPEETEEPGVSEEIQGIEFLGVQRSGVFCPCVLHAVELPQVRGLTLIAYVDPMVYQTTMRSVMPDNSVVAIVDREGEFLARSLDYYDRVGTQATSFVLDAVANGGSGIYEGRTFEGLVNYTAYSTSDLTGWSAHVAIDNVLLDVPVRQANLLSLAAALSAVCGSFVILLMGVRDIATRRQEAEAMIELQRAEALSQFTATVVHDFRNLIAAILSGLRIISRKAQSEEIGAHVAMIEATAIKGSRLANQLLSFSSRPDTEIAPVDLNALIRDLEYLLTQAAGNTVPIEASLPERELVALVNRDQLELALLNLVINARDAMDGRGLIRIETIPNPETIEIRVTDTGPSVNEPRKESIFNAFETDKQNGTGLGLAQVMGMARQANGKVFVRDAEGGGACFVIVLPKAANIMPAQFGPVTKRGQNS